MSNKEVICFVCKEEYDLIECNTEYKDFYSSNNGYTLSHGLGVNINNKFYCIDCLTKMGIKYRKQRDKINNKNKIDK